MKPSLKGKFERKWIPGYEGEYAAAVNGVIWSYKRSLMGMPLKPGLSTKNRKPNDHYVKLLKNKVEKTFYIAGLVLTTFVGLRPEGMECCHYDDIKKNNSLNNLRWDTPRANRLDALRNNKGGGQ